MKKIITVLSLMLVFILASCGSNGGGGGEEKSALQALLHEPEESCFITVITNISPSESLISTYDMRVTSNGTTQIKVIFQQLSEFKSQNDAYNTNKQNYITTTEAFYIIEDGEVIKNVGGKGLNWTPTGEFPKFNLSDDYLENVSDSPGYFSANITDIKGFAGWDVSCTDATVNISYSDDSVNSVNVYCTNASGNKTEVRYSFGG